LPRALSSRPARPRLIFDRAIDAFAYPLPAGAGKIDRTPTLMLT
jgi:hypothetical protein